MTQAWAAALRAAGYDGLVAPLRHDSGASSTVALFGRQGARARLAGWAQRTTHLTDRALLAEVAVFGTGVLDRP